MKKLFAAAIALSFLSAPTAFAAQSHISPDLVHQVKVHKKAKAKKPAPKRHVKKPVRKPVRKPIRH